MFSLVAGIIKFDSSGLRKIENFMKTTKAKIAYTYVGTLAYRGRLLKQISTLQEAGFDCRLICGDWGARPLNKEDYNFPIDIIPTSKKWGGFALFLRELRFGYVAARIIAESDVTHVVSFSLESLLAGALAKRMRPDLKLIFDSNELHLECFVSKVKKFLWAPIQKYCVKKCDVVMHAEENRLKYFKKHHDRTNRLQFLLENFPNYLERKGVGESPASSPIRVLYVGCLGWDRYTSELFDIFRELAPEYSLDLVGPMSPPAFESKFDEHRKSHPAPNVRVLPPIPYPEMENLIRKYHVGIALYKNNNLNNYYCAPNKVYDYLMSGVPVVANDYPGLKRVLEGGEVGACVAEVNLENFRTALEEIRSERRWENITDEVRERYSWEAQTPGFLALFD